MLSAEIVALLYFDNSLKSKVLDDQSKPRMELSVFCDEDDIDETTRRHITYQIQACRIDVMVVYKDTLARLGSPIVGYAASIFERALFQPHLLHNLFHGISIIKCSSKVSNRASTTTELEEFTNRIRIVAPYRSSLPLKFKHPDDDWEPSLGDHGWVMLGTREYVKKGGTITNRDMCLVVYTTVDRAVMEEFELVMQDAYERRLTMKQAETEILKIYRNYTIENRKRILHRIHKHVTHDLVGHSVRSARQINCIRVTQSTQDALADMKIPDYKSLPITFSIPRVGVENEDDSIVDNFSPYNYTMEPETDIIFSDITPSTEMQQYVMRSNCCKIENEVIRLEGGPCDMIHVYNVPDVCHSLKWLDSFPCIGTGKNKLPYDDDYFSFAGLKRSVLDMMDQGQRVYECINERDEKYRIIPKMVVFDKSQIN